MREELVEVLVKCKKNILLTVGMLLLYIICGLVALYGLFTGNMIVVLVGVAIGFGGYALGSKSSVEYEYTYCSKEIDVDVIYSQIKRKKVTTIDLSKMEALVRVNSSKMNEFNNRQFIVKDFSSKKADHADEVYALIYDDNIKYLIEPGERMLNAISYVCPRKIFKD